MRRAGILQGVLLCCVAGASAGHTIRHSSTVPGAAAIGDTVWIHASLDPMAGKLSGTHHVVAGGFLYGATRRGGSDRIFRSGFEEDGRE